MATLYILLICSFLPGILSQCNVERARPMLKRSAYDFAIELSNRIAVEKDNHFVAATLSPWTVLSIAAQGATGGTLDELRRVLRLHQQPCFNDRYFELIQTVVSEPNATLERSTTIFVDTSLPIKDEFRKKVTDARVAGFETLSFSDPDSVAATINDYVSRATHDTINDIIVPSDLDLVVLIMVDAVYFKGLWKNPFPFERTAIEPFYNDRGAQIGEVNMMSVTASFKITWITQIETKVIELPFGSNGRYAMLVFLPYEDSNLSRLIDSLKRINLMTIYTMFERDGVESQVRVVLPRFKITSDHNNLKELLSDMGLQSAFDENKAQFSAISDDSLFITNFVQKANIEVTEEGSEASAATAALFGTRTSPERFDANRPFFYMIVDTQNQLPIFTGAYSKPSVY